MNTDGILRASRTGRPAPHVDVPVDLAAAIVKGASTRTRRQLSPHEFLTIERARENIAAVLGGDFIGTPAYGLAVQAEWLCQLLEGRRAIVREGKRHRWTPDEDARVIAGEDAGLIADDVGVARRVVIARRTYLRGKGLIP